MSPDMEYAYFISSLAGGRARIGLWEIKRTFQFSAENTEQLPHTGNRLYFTALLLERKVWFGLDCPLLKEKHL